MFCTVQHEADKKWSEYQTDFGEPGDINSLAIARLRMLTAMDDRVKVDEVAATEFSNGLVMIVADGQNVAPEELKRQRRALPEGHHSGLGQSRKTDFGSVAPAMLASGFGGLGGRAPKKRRCSVQMLGGGEGVGRHWNS